MHGPQHMSKCSGSHLLLLQGTGYTLDQKSLKGKREVIYRVAPGAHNVLESRHFHVSDSDGPTTCQYCPVTDHTPTRRAVTPYALQQILPRCNRLLGVLSWTLGAPPWEICWVPPLGWEIMTTPDHIISIWCQTTHSAVSTMSTFLPGTCSNLIR